MEEALLKLEVYPLSHDLSIRIHEMTLKLPELERFEEAPQIRRSSKRVNANIVEGHTLRKYKGQYLFFLYRALASSDETQEHLILLKKTRSLKDDQAYRSLLAGYERLSGKLFRLITSIERGHQTPNYLKDLECDAPPEGPLG